MSGNSVDFDPVNQLATVSVTPFGPLGVFKLC